MLKISTAQNRATIMTLLQENVPATELGFNPQISPVPLAVNQSSSDFGFGTQIRKSPYFDATVRWGAAALVIQSKTFGT
jgi:hypothetical protein